MRKSFDRRLVWGSTTTAAVLATLIAPSAGYAQARTTYSFDIPAQDLGGALRAFGRVSGQQLAFDETQLRGKRSSGLKGGYSAEEGLKRLLAGSDMVAQPTASGVYAIRGRSLLVAASATAQAAPAVAAEPPAQPEAPSEVEEVIVVGTPGGAGIDKLSASFAVSTVNAADITKASPKSSAELLALVPGVWVETSGGVAGANVFVRGFPATGDAEFLTIQLQGAPIYPPSTLSFLENSSIFRVDETISRMEALRGGPNPIFSNGQPGLTTNFMLKEGGEETKGLVKASTSDYGLRRIDGVVSGKLADDLFFMVGGYVARSPGIRDTQFDSEKGQQFTVNLTKKLENGKINLYARATDDHGAWYLPFAINVPGVDKGTYTQLGELSRHQALQVHANGATRSFDLADGRGWKGYVAGGSFEHEFGDGWTVRDRFSFTKGDANTYGLVPDGGAVTAASVATVIGGPVATRGGTVLGANDYVQAWGAWIVEKEIEALTNDFSVSKTFGTHEVSAGYYASSFSSDDFWTIGNFRPMQVKANGDYLAANVSCANLATAGSGTGCWNYGLVSAGDGRVDALYLADAWQATEALRIDLGVRRERFKTDYVVDDGNGYPDGLAIRTTDYSQSKTSYTVGANYDLNDVSGVFVRYSRGYKFPSFDNFRENLTDTLKVDQYELGYKLRSGPFELYATGFANEFKGAKFADVGGIQESNTNKAHGIELDGRWRSDFGLSLALNGTFQKTEIKQSSIPANAGNSAQRQPDWQIRFTPSWDVQLGTVDATFYGTLSAVDDRYGDNANTQVLKGYEKLDLGAIFRVAQFDVQIAADNLTDSHGLTEGDPRSTSGANARPILGRSVRLSVGYNF
ncbi:TonB-dependent receptor domain-containing protein [Caulobacter endophyticus]|uniref:TonB-dependent receptor domain-containing protein n=1 Tax=Caulobacter endophyticus TaxID=2172652 RepID=UPI00240FE7B7|nr:TonB-dependent receptor [Caulobacter endophyticus]MDG2528010.1 TonB-dependent receptor [Caulobacter endophyticus]